MKNHIPIWGILTLLFIICSCNRDDNEPKMKTGIVVYSTIDEMIHYPDVDEFELTLDVEGIENPLLLPVKRSINNTFTSDFVELPLGEYRINRVYAKFSDNHLDDLFGDLALCIPGDYTYESRFSVETNSYALPIKLASVTYDSPRTRAVKTNFGIDRATSKNTLFLFVNRCNSDAHASVYHEVLRYELEFTNPSVANLDSGIVYNNFRNTEIPLLAICNGSELSEVSVPIDIKVIPYDDDDGDGVWEVNDGRIGDEYNQLSISVKEWNDYVNGSTSFVHIQIGCGESTP